MCVMFLSVMLTGCEFFGPDPLEDETSPEHITVTVKIRVQAVIEKRNPETNEVWSIEPYPGATIKISASLAWEWPKTYIETTDSNGFTNIVEPTLKIKDYEDITVSAEFSEKPGTLPGQDFQPEDADPPIYSNAIDSISSQVVKEAGGEYGKSVALSSSLTVKAVISEIPP
jgi:hypothetical protein